MSRTSMKVCKRTRFRTDISPLVTLYGSSNVKKSMTLRASCPVEDFVAFRLSYTVGNVPISQREMTETFQVPCPVEDFLAFRLSYTVGNVLISMREMHLLHTSFVVLRAGFSFRCKLYQAWFPPSPEGGV